MRQDIAAEARGRWPSILAALGVADEFLRDKQTRCPICGQGKTRYRFDDKEGRGSFIANCCGAGDGFALLMGIRGIEFKEAAKLVESVLPQSVVAAKKAAPKASVSSLRKMWDGAKPLQRGDAADVYLRSRETPIELDVFPASLRLHPSLPYYVKDEEESVIRVGNFPAMLALVRGVRGGGVAIHRTYLKGGAEKERKAIGDLPEGSAIWLYRPTEALAVTEGIESALGYMQKKGVPAWSCISDGGLKKFIPPHGVTKVIVAGDNDANFVGQSAAYDLAKRLHNKGISVSVDIPEKVGTDWAD